MRRGDGEAASADVLPDDCPSARRLYGRPPCRTGRSSVRFLAFTPRTAPSRLEAKLNRFLKPTATRPPAAVSLLRELFPAPATFTEDDLGDLTGKVYIITGANAGLGRELADILYSKNATVYVGARSAARANAAMAAIRAAHPASRGRLVLLLLDLADLATIRPAVAAFLQDESRLHVLFNNAGVMCSPGAGTTTTKQGHERQLGTNCLGPFLLTTLLAPTLAATARTSPADSVRVVWVACRAAETLSAPTGGGFAIADLDGHASTPKSTAYQYGVSKAGVFYYATEFARRHGGDGGGGGDGGDGIVSVVLHPGRLNTALARQKSVLNMPSPALLHPPRKGAYTALFCRAGAGRDGGARAHRQLDPALWRVWADPRRHAGGGAAGRRGGHGGLAAAFWALSEAEVRIYGISDTEKG